MFVEVKNGENLAALLKAFPNAKVRPLITRPACDCWRVEIPEEPRPPISHQLEWEDKDGNRYIINGDWGTVSNLFDILKNFPGIDSVSQRRIPGTDLPEEDEDRTAVPDCGPAEDTKLPAESPGTATDEELDEMDREPVTICRLKREDGKKVWVMFDAITTLRGEPGESERSIKERWRKTTGEIQLLNKIKGTVRPSELAMMLSKD